ncbi:MAG: phosphoribosylanthranilate isomerase [Gemmatimonadaceae bacterium]
MTGPVATAIKFCGLTRAADAALAAELGARFAGVIFAGGPRLLTAARAREVFAPLAGTPLRRVGVFGEDPVVEIARIADSTGVDVVQLHGGATPAIVRQLRKRLPSGTAIWAVVRVAAGESLPPDLAGIATVADALVIDAAVQGMLGGTGVALDWARLEDDMRRLRDEVPLTLVLAGGLRAENVGRAVHLLRPDVVDVSSGVESAPGIKDSLRMRDFARAVRSAMDEVPES